MLKCISSEDPTTAIVFLMLFNGSNDRHSVGTKTFNREFNVLSSVGGIDEDVYRRSVDTAVKPPCIDLRSADGKNGDEP